MADEGKRRHAVGIDVGGTKIAGGLGDLATGAVTARRALATAAGRGGAAVLDDALGLAEGLLAEAADRRLAVAGIGVGVPELVDLAGNVKSMHNFDWTGLPVRARFARLAPAVVDSDVRAAARGEARFGAARGLAHCVYVTVGTGISYCLCIDGVPYAGAAGNAIHFATSALTLRCPCCGERIDPVVERIASGPGLVERFNALTGESVAGAEAVLAAAAAGRKEAVEVVESAAETLGALLGLVINMLDPQAVVIGGGLGLSGGLYWARLTAATRAHVWAADRRDLPLLRAALGADSGIVGAAVTAQG